MENLQSQNLLLPSPSPSTRSVSLTYSFFLSLSLTSLLHSLFLLFTLFLDISLYLKNLLAQTSLSPPRYHIGFPNIFILSLSLSAPPCLRLLSPHPGYLLFYGKFASMKSPSTCQFKVSFLDILSLSFSPFYLLFLDIFLSLGNLLSQTYFSLPRYHISFLNPWRPSGSFMVQKNGYDFSYPRFSRVNISSFPLPPCLPLLPSLPDIFSLRNLLPHKITFFRIQN